VCVVLVTDRRIRQLNRRYGRTDRVTDVLAFPADPVPGRMHVLGDVVVSIDRARVQAKTVGHPLRSEVALLAVHGLLHLLGYDDHTRSAARTMADRQRDLVAECGEEVRG